MITTGEQNSDTMKALVVYYSRTGHTKKAAETIAEMLGCDREEIIDKQGLSGPLGWLRSGYQTTKKSLTELKDLESDLSVYDLVIIGTPVWAGTVSVPVRTFVSQYKDLLCKVAFFSTHSGDETQNEFVEMEALCKTQPVSVVSFSSKEVEKEDYIEKVKEFVSGLEEIS